MILNNQSNINNSNNNINVTNWLSQTEKSILMGINFNKGNKDSNGINQNSNNYGAPSFMLNDSKMMDD